jgi:D-alanyl-D-alanine carboxypeptidase
LRHQSWIVAVSILLCVNANAQEDKRLDTRRLNTGSHAPSHVTERPTSESYVLTPLGKSTSGLDPAMAYALQRALDSIRTEQGVKGLSAAVFMPEQGLWKGVSGISSQYPLANADTSMVFGIGSNTKAFVSTAILSLVDEGLVSLDDSLGRYLPAYPNVGGYITIRELLNMTSGLFDYLNDSNAQGDSVASNPMRRWMPDELIRTFVGPPKALPGGSYSYCNTDYILLGMVISSVTGKSVSSQIRQRILAPLSLNHTFLEVEESYPDPVAHPWDSGVDFNSIPVTAHFSTLWTAGGIMSTATDMARWVKALYEGSVLSQSSLAQMLTWVSMSSTPATGLQWSGYGLGVRQGSYYGKKVYGHTGAVMGYVSITGYIPRAGASFAILFNSSEASTGNALTALIDAYLRKVNPQTARPGVCYALSGTSDSTRLYLTDSTTAALTPLGTTEYGRLVGARVHPRTGAFWGLASAIGWELVRIDGETGHTYPRVRVTFPSGAPSDFKGLAFSPDGKLYVGSVDGRIYTIDTTTGMASLAVTTGLSISGLAFDPTNGALWASIRTSPVLRDRIYTVSLLSGDSVGVGNTGFNQPLVDIDFDPAGNLFALIGNPTSSLKYRLARIDKGTGVGREIGSLGLGGMVGIAFSSTPATASVATQWPVETPMEILLEQNYPNPFNPTTKIGFRVSGLGSRDVRLSVYDILGREVAVLVNETLPEGHYEVRFDGSSLPSGLYIYRLTSRGTTVSKKALLLR